MRNVRESKLVRGGTEASFTVALTELAVDAAIQFVPWFQPRRTTILIILGAFIGALVRKTLSKFLWRTT